MHSAWELGPFTPHAGPILGTDPELRFRCPVIGHTVRWAAKDVFNPGAVAHDGQVCLLVRAEDGDARVAGTSRIGLAVSDDGVRFELASEPVLLPADDEWQAWEWPGGCEDPRVVESPEGGFVCTYTAFNGRTACLFVATSPDLRTWRKHGPAFAGTRHASRWSKSGSIVTELRDGRLIAVRVRDRYWMYWGEGTCFAATSDDLIHWQPLEYEADRDRYLTRADEGAAPAAATGPSQWKVHTVPGTRVLRPVLFPRQARFDSLLAEPGPPAVSTDRGIVLVYNGANHPRTGEPSIPAFAYTPGQALFDGSDPAACIARTCGPFLDPAVTDAAAGQVGNVCFGQGLVCRDERWLLYSGLADSRVGLATAPVGAPGFRQLEG